MSDQVRWYTAARRFPLLIGKMPDGRKIPLGPFTILQLVVGVVAVIVMALTQSVWAGGGPLVNLVVFMLVVGGSVMLAGQIPPGIRNPLLWLAGVWRALVAPPLGMVNGLPLRVSVGTVRVRSWADAPADRVAAAVGEGVDLDRELVCAPVVSSAPAVLPAPPAVPARVKAPLSNVQRLLAGAN